MKLKPKIQLPSRIKKAAEHVQPARKGDDEKRIRELAQQWADLHAKPKQRDQMDELLAGLPEDTARRVILCGMRIAAGMSPKVVP